MKAKKELYYTRILICVLLAVSIVSLFLPWMNLHITVRGKNYTLGDLFEASRHSWGYYGEGWYGDDAVDQYKEEVYEDWEQLLERNDSSPFSSRSSQVIKALRGVENGQITVLEYVHLLSLLPSSFGALGAVVFVILLSFIIMLLVVFYIFFTGELIYNRKPLILYMICCALILLTVLFSIGAVNKSITSTFHDNIVDMLWDLDLIDSHYPIRTSLLHVSYGGFLCIGFALAAYGATFLKDGKISLPSRRSLVNIGGWSCPSCGESCQMNMSFCPACGTKKPQPPRCTHCGRILHESQRFCPGCGTENSRLMRCTNCGSPIEGTYRFCRSCGKVVDAEEFPQQPLE